MYIRENVKIIDSSHKLAYFSQTSSQKPNWPSPSAKVFPLKMHGNGNEIHQQIKIISMFIGGRDSLVQ
jgi:hypothetical protein